MRNLTLDVRETDLFTKTRRRFRLPGKEKQKNNIRLTEGNGDSRNASICSFFSRSTQIHIKQGIGFIVSRGYHWVFRGHSSRMSECLISITLNHVRFSVNSCEWKYIFNFFNRESK